MYRFESKRAFGRSFFIAIGIGCIIAICDFVFSCKPMIKNMMEMVNSTVIGKELIEKTDYSICVWECFMGLRMSPLSYTYSFVIPLLCAFAYNGTYVKDRNGYLSGIVGRTSVREYAACKMIFGFVTAGCIAVVPLILNFIVCMCFFPLVKPVSAVGRFSVLYVSVLDNIFYENTFIYFIIYMIFVFVFYGLLNCTYIIGCRVENNHLIAFILPFGIYYITNAVCIWIFNDSSWSPMVYTYFPTFYKSAAICVMFQMIVLLLADFVGYMRIITGDN